MKSMSGRLLRAKYVIFVSVTVDYGLSIYDFEYSIKGNFENFPTIENLGDNRLKFSVRCAGLPDSLFFSHC